MRRSKLTLAVALLLAMLLAACAVEAPLAGGATLATQGVLPDIAPEDAPSDSEPLVNQNSYRDASDVDMAVEDLYIKVYPTYDETGKLITREEFKKHKALVKDFNPTLNAHIWQGSPDDPDGQNERFGFDSSEYNCTIRVRGNHSRGAPVKSFKVKLTNTGDTLFGTDSLNLNKHIYDDTRTANKMCMDLMQMIQQGIISFETKFVRLYINDVGIDGGETGFVDQGLYVWIEQPNPEFLQSHGLDPNGTIYKPDLFEFSVTDALRTEDDPLYDEAEFTKVIKPMVNPDHAKLIGMLEDLNDLSLDYNEVFDTYFDEENYLTWMAVNVLFGNEDTLTHNMLLYSPSNSKKWYFLPWDYDEALAYNEVDQWSDRFYQQFGVHYFWTVPLHQRYFRIEGNVDKLLMRIDELMETVFTKENFDILNSGYLKVLDEYLVREPDIGMLIETYKKQERELRLDDNEALSAAEIYQHIYTEKVELRYPAAQNNRQRYSVALESPTSFFIQAPIETEDGWLFSWDTAFDFQGDLVTYEIILSTGYEWGRLNEEGDTGFHQTGIFYQQGDLSQTSITVPELPQGPVFYRVLATDAQGNIQYSRNSAIIPRDDGSGSNWHYQAIGYIYNE